jgi:PAS domain S-box-containing protein
MSDQNGLKSKPRILLVDDEATVREHLARSLSDAYVVDTAASGREALRAVLRAMPDLVATDIVMPDVDGIELLKALRSTRHTRMIPVLLISGRAIDEQRIAGFQEGADGYLAKPYTERELRAYIASMLHGAHMRKEAAKREAREEVERQALADRAELLESITDAFYALDGEYHFTYVNQRALDHFGATREALLGKALWDVFPVLRGTVFQKEYEHALREQCTVAFEAVSPLNGRWLDVRAYRTRHGLAVYFRDITHRKRTEEQLRQADRRKSEFLAVLSHELRNPLGALRNGLQILQQRTDRDAAVSATVSMMGRQMTQLMRLVDDLLDVSRIAQGKLELRRRRVILADVLGNAIESSRAFIEAQGQQLSVDLRVDDLVVDGDPDRLAQVFSNLLCNSARYTHSGGCITVTLERENAEAVVAVQDNGVGLPTGSLEHIFDLFSQVRSSHTHATGGLGIGLSLVRRLVQMHGGTVRASSEGPGTGSRFTVRLPVDKLAGASVDGGPRPPGAASSSKVG